MTISALVDGLFDLRGSLSRPASTALADTVSVILLVMWIAADRKDHPQIERPFDYGFLVLMFWLPYLPYYLWRSRGAAGLWMFVGFLGLFWLGSLIQTARLLVIGWNQQFFALPR